MGPAIVLRSIVSCVALLYVQNIAGQKIQTADPGTC